MMKQKTILQTISLSGVGVHSGQLATITLHPATPNSGIIIKNKHFQQEPLRIGLTIPEQAMHATVLKHERWAVSTIEHLFSAIAGLGIDNLVIEVDGSEFPILDGSALPFVHAFEQGGIKIQPEQKKFLSPKVPLSFEENDRYIKILPAKKNRRLDFTYSIHFEHPLVPQGTLSGTLTPEYFAKEIAPARTFGFLEQLPLLRKHGLAKGTTLGNTVVVGENMFLNSSRFENELIRHKFLDLLGDLALLGKPLAGTISAHKTGHAFNRKVVEHFIQNPNQWEIISK
jgi:UDP-3-O-[3-hydroxymyristoyl] N-acetylglucosamine deacetylase